MSPERPRWLSYLPFGLAVVEIVLFVAVGQWIGFGWAVLGYLATSVLGVAVLQREGSRAWAALRSAATSGRMPEPTAGDRRARLLGGVLLTVPGLLTDVSGLLLFLPPVQHAVARRAPQPRIFGPGGSAAQWGPGGTQRGGPDRSASGDSVVEGEVIQPEGGADSHEGGTQEQDENDPGANRPKGRELGDS